MDTLVKEKKKICISISKYITVSVTTLAFSSVQFSRSVVSETLALGTIKKFNYCEMMGS